MAELEQFNNAGKPDIRPYFLLYGGMFPDDSVFNFRRKLRALGYDTDTMSSFEKIKTDMQSVLINYFVHSPDSAAPSDGRRSTNLPRTEADFQETTSVDKEEPFYREKPKNAEDSDGGEPEKNSGEVWKRNAFLRCLKALQEGPLRNYPAIERIRYQGMDMAKRWAKLTPNEREDALKAFEKALEQSVDRLKRDNNENTREFNERLGALMEMRKALRNGPPPTA